MRYRNERTDVLYSHTSSWLSFDHSAGNTVDQLQKTFYSSPLTTTVNIPFFTWRVHHCTLIYSFLSFYVYFTFHAKSSLRCDRHYECWFPSENLFQQCLWSNRTWLFKTLWLPDVGGSKKRAVYLVTDSFLLGCFCRHRIPLVLKAHAENNTNR